MKNIRIKVITLAIIMLVVLSGAKIVNADESVGMSLTSSSKLKAGETVTVSVNYTQSVTGGIGSIMGTLNYDSDVLEYVSVAAAGDWQAAVYTKSTNILGIERNNNTTTTGAIATITFKVKEGITATSTTISYNITDVGLTNTVSIPTSVTLNAEKEAEAKPGNTTVTTQTPGTTKNTANTSKNITASKSNKKILAAGDATSIALITAVGVIAVIAIVGFVKYSKNKDIK